MASIAEVFAAIARERSYQDRKWGALDTYHHNIDRWMEIASEEFDEAVAAWADIHVGAHVTQAELLQAAAVIVACLEQHGVVEREAS